MGRCCKSVWGSVAGQSARCGEVTGEMVVAVSLVGPDRHPQVVIIPRGRMIWDGMPTQRGDHAQLAQDVWNWQGPIQSCRCR